MRALLAAALGACLASSPVPALGAVPVHGFSDQPLAGGLSRPTAMAFAPDGRLFICLQGGQIRVLKNGSLLTTPFLSLTVDSVGERGLLGIAFDPAFAANRFVYVYYTVPSTPRHNRVSRFTAEGDRVVAGSELVLLELDDLTAATNHNGGALHFGVDGRLYVGVGENANGSNAQSLANLLGKMLRINTDGSIPGDNPFASTATGVNRAIWALGLRNPFTFAFHPVTGRMLINDVGLSTWEEINEGRAGANYGWPATEGPTANGAFQSPLYAYRHGSGATSGCAIAGGAFYVPTVAAFPAEYVDDYFFADLCSGWINRHDAVTGVVSTFASGLIAPVDLRVGPDGALYYLERGTTSGRVGRIVPAAPVSQPTAAIDLPSGSVVTQPFIMEGWAVDLGATSGTGVDAVHVWAYLDPGSGIAPVFVGSGQPVSRPDVAATYGPRFERSGYRVTVRGLRPGPYRLVAFARSTVSGAFSARWTSATVRTNPAMAIGRPINGDVVSGPLLVAGWAIDRAAATGTGIDAVHVWAFPAKGGAAQFLGAAEYGFSRPDVGAVFGAQFTASGWGLVVHGLAPGRYRIVAYGHSSVAATFNVALGVSVQVL